jgi:hypothetical protein
MERRRTAGGHEGLVEGDHDPARRNPDRLVSENAQDECHDDGHEL